MPTSNGQPVQQTDIAGILAILSQTVNHQTQILEEIRTNQKQLSSTVTALDARVAKLEGLMQGTSSGEPGGSGTSPCYMLCTGICNQFISSPSLRVSHTPYRYCRRGGGLVRDHRANPGRHLEHIYRAHTRSIAGGCRKQQTSKY